MNPIKMAGNAIAPLATVEVAPSLVGQVLGKAPTREFSFGRLFTTGGVLSIATVLGLIGYKTVSVSNQIASTNKKVDEVKEGVEAVSEQVVANYERSVKNARVLEDTGMASVHEDMRKIADAAGETAYENKFERPYREQMRTNKRKGMSQEEARKDAFAKADADAKKAGEKASSKALEGMSERFTAFLKSNAL